MVWYLPMNRSASQPPSSGEEVNADDERVKHVFCRALAFPFRQM
jgi:hypothetical protein